MQAIKIDMEYGVYIYQTLKQVTVEFLMILYLKSLLSSKTAKRLKDCPNGLLIFVKIHIT